MKSAIATDALKGSDKDKATSRNYVVSPQRGCSPDINPISGDRVHVSAGAGGKPILGVTGSLDLGKAWRARSTKSVAKQDLANTELSHTTISMSKALRQPVVMRDLALITSGALCNVAFGILFLLVVHAVKLTFGVFAIVMCCSAMCTFIFETSSRPYSISHYFVSLVLVPIAILGILLVLPEGDHPKEYVLNAAGILLFGQLWGIEVHRYFKSPLVKSVYHDKQWKLPHVTGKIAYFFIALILSAIAVTPIMWIIPYVLFIWEQLLSLHKIQGQDLLEDGMCTGGYAEVCEVLIILHMPILKLALDMLQRKILTKLLESVSSIVVNCTLMAVEGFTTMAIKFLVVSSPSFHVGVAAGISAQLIQTLTTTVLIRRAYDDVIKGVRGGREQQLHRLRILMQCAHGDLLLQLQSVLVTCIAKYNIQKDARFMQKYPNSQRLESIEILVIALAQIVPEIICNYFLLAYMLRMGLQMNIYGTSLKGTIGAVIMSMAFPMAVLLFFVFA